MRNSLRRVIAALFTVILISGTVAFVCNSATAESMYIRKIVSVVYDDSGSMSGDKWAYANYAMQTFCGMLNSDDQLFITYMSHTQKRSNYSPEKIDLSAQGIQNSVDQIRNHSSSGSTPYAAVEMAYEKLKNVKDSNPNTQYWLVVITDGVFDEYNSKNDNQRKDILNQHFDKYSKGVMPNGSNPQITFLGIGKVAVPDENRSKGIYTYSASNAKDICDAMFQMADRVSGRTRLQTGDVKKLNDNTIQVTSSIPLLDIVVFTQESNARITDAVYDNEHTIPISRVISLNYPGYKSLVGGAYLLGDLQNVIGSGTYNISFDQKVDLDDMVVLFEPALEMRMSIEVNGESISKHSDLDMLMEGDAVSVSCKICEMGTNKEVEASLLPPNTKYELIVSENGNTITKITDDQMQLKDYVLKHADTGIAASAYIEGFNPITYEVEFTPCEYVPPAIVYSITPSFGSGMRSVKSNQIADNNELSVCFTVYADGVAITDPNEVKALNPTISVSPRGNDGDIAVADDGKIVFVPKVSDIDSTDEESIVVEVKCTIDDGTFATEKYTVEKTKYSIIPSFGSDIRSVKSNHIADNEKLSVCFSFYADGAIITNPDEIRALNPSIGVLPLGNDGDVVLTDDGKVVFTPKTCSIGASDKESIDVEVKCTIDKGASTSEKYTVVKTVFTIVPSFGSDVRSVKIDDIADNEELTICFDVYEDGVRITDVNAVRMLNPAISILPGGNDGDVEFSDDGQIIFTPKEAGMLSSSEETLDVEVKCTISDGASASEKYTIVKAVYQVIPVTVDQTVRKTELFDNRINASFYITKDGSRLYRDDIGKNITIRLNDEYSLLKVKVDVSEDGLIAVTPYSEEKHELTFWNWWSNWVYYFRLESQDMVVSMTHTFGSADNRIEVVNAETKYLILNVFAPLALEILFAVMIIAYIIRYFTKARFTPNGVLYVGSIERNSRIIGTHRLELIEVRLNQYNKFKNLWNPFKELTVSVNGISITAAKGNKIICNELFPWFSDEVLPKAAASVRINSPKDIVNHCEKNTGLVIREIMPASVMDEQNRVISQDDSVYYFVKADIASVKMGTKQIEVIDSAVAFCYSTI